MKFSVLLVIYIMLGHWASDGIENEKLKMDVSGFIFYLDVMLFLSYFSLLLL